jgi:NitT/TauT family transport system permease protein
MVGINALVNTRSKPKNGLAQFQTRYGKFAFILPVLSLLVAFIFDLILPNKQQPTVSGTYKLVLLIILGIYVLFNLISLRMQKLRDKIRNIAPILSVAILLLLLWDLITLKFNWLEYRFFPNPDAVFNVFVTDWHNLGTNLLFSLRLFFIGVSIGGIIGFAAGVAMGWSRKWRYWLHPMQRVLYAIPATAWLPIVLLKAPTTFSAGVFLVALAAAVPVSVMTSTGISNVDNSYFEVSRTLGASNKYMIFRVAVPAALPTIFIGLFNSFCVAFVALNVAEQAGVKAGIGWYMTFQVGMLQYQEMYACLILIALTFCGLITLLFMVRDRMLGWQQGGIKW